MTLSVSVTTQSESNLYPRQIETSPQLNFTGSDQDLTTPLFIVLKKRNRRLSPRQIQTSMGFNFIKSDHDITPTGQLHFLYNWVRSNSYYVPSGSFSQRHFGSRSEVSPSSTVSHWVFVSQCRHQPNNSTKANQKCIF